jgi:ATP-dependent RNA helicase RhlE
MQENTARNSSSDQDSSKRFSQFGFSAPLLSSIHAVGYEVPTPIQAKAIPVVLGGSDVLGLAQTGTGKTAAFVLPLLQHIESGKLNKLSTLIIAPTRELAIQINDVVKSFTKGSSIKSTTIFGGVGMEPQVSALRRGCHIVVACPGRLLDHINKKTIDLSTIEYLVLDEADQMFDMGFLPTIKKVVKALPVKRQTMLFSATMPTEIRSLASGILKDPVTVEVGHLMPAKTVAHSLYPVTPNQKTDLLLALLKATPTDSAIIFTRTKHRAKRLGMQLEKAGYKATSLQGNLSQNRRQEAMKGFRAGTYDIMVATDIAARGIDISTVSLVVNYDIPETPETYTHRIGRTGRAERSGEAFTLVSPDDKRKLMAIEKVLGKAIERRQLPGFSYGAEPIVGPADTRPERSSRGGSGDRRGQRSNDKPNRDSRRPERRDEQRGAERRERPTRGDSQRDSQARQPRSGSGSQERNSRSARSGSDRRDSGVRRQASDAASAMSNGHNRSAPPRREPEYDENGQRINRKPQRVESLKRRGGAPRNAKSPKRMDGDGSNAGGSGAQREVFRAQGSRNTRVISVPGEFR